MKLDSKTIFGLLVLLLVVVGLDIFHLLTDQAVSAIEWIGGSFMGVRMAANVSENFGTSTTTVTTQVAPTTPPGASNTNG